MANILTVAELFRKVPQYATNGPKGTRSGDTGPPRGRSIKPESVKRRCVEKRAEGKSYAQISRELRAEGVQIDRETVSVICREPEIWAAIQGEYEAGLERIKHAVREEFARSTQRWHEERAAAREQRIAAWRAGRKRAHEKYLERKAHEQEQAARAYYVIDSRYGAVTQRVDPPPRPADEPRVSLPQPRSAQPGEGYAAQRPRPTPPPARPDTGDGKGQGAGASAPPTMSDEERQRQRRDADTRAALERLRQRLEQEQSAAARIRRALELLAPI